MYFFVLFLSDWFQPLWRCTESRVYHDDCALIVFTELYWHSRSTIAFIELQPQPSLAPIDSHCRNSDMVGCYSNSLETAVMQHIILHYPELQRELLELVSNIKNSCWDILRILGCVVNLLVLGVALFAHEHSRMFQTSLSTATRSSSTWGISRPSPTRLDITFLHWALGVSGFRSPSVQKSLEGTEILARCPNYICCSSCSAKEDSNPFCGSSVHTSHSKVHRFIVTCGQNCVIFNPSHCKIH